jgi:hypothetical protein
MRHARRAVRYASIIRSEDARRHGKGASLPERPPFVRERPTTPSRGRMTKERTGRGGAIA